MLARQMVLFLGLMNTHTIMHASRGMVGGLNGLGQFGQRDLRDQVRIQCQSMCSTTLMQLPKSLCFHSHVIFSSKKTRQHEDGSCHSRNHVINQFFPAGHTIFPSAAASLPSHACVIRLAQRTTNLHCQLSPCARARR